MENPEILPDIPNILSALEETLSKLKITEDYTRISKRDLALDIEIILDALMDLTKFVVAKAYKLDILDKAIARNNTLLEDVVEEEVEVVDEVLEVLDYIG